MKPLSMKVDEVRFVLGLGDGKLMLSGELAMAWEGYIPPSGPGITGHGERYVGQLGIFVDFRFQPWSFYP